MAKIIGANLAGFSTTRERVEEDFYATPRNAITTILEKEKLNGNILEPACGDGAIAKVIKEYYPKSELTCIDIVDRGYPNTIIDNFLTADIEYGKYDTIITNPPFKLAKEFIEKSISIGASKILMFAKIQLLESEERGELFDKYPPKYVYVFRKRVNPLRNGSEVDENGKKWSSTMCFAWYVWEKDYVGEPIIRWL